MTEPTFPRPFVAQRDEDVSGVSGEGVIAEGVQFSDGWVVTHWLDQPPMHEPKTDVWHNKGSRPFERIHGHGGATRILWADDVADARRKLAADLVEAFDVPGWIAGPETEREVLRRKLTRAVQSVQDGEAMPVEVGDERIIDAVMPIVADLAGQRERAARAVGRAYRLAGLWQAAHGSSMFLVRVAGVDLREALDESRAQTAPVVHSDEIPQVTNISTVGESGLVCVCGGPVKWMERPDDPDWIHAPGCDTECLHARPRCPDCQLPHRLAPGVTPLCRSIREHMSATVGPAPAAECSARHAQFSRHCIRAAHHRGDHIDEHGFHWSDTVATYPRTEGQPRCSRAVLDQER
ncbi:hypothetical protein ACF06P_35675 [Streptomyces sp. NPDC015684]|uniref:hypothetical protein n=1 Tax=Streptomyces sp. NPDC015684 TaxID=3364963 RepID=UPI0036F85F28